MLHPLDYCSFPGLPLRLNCQPSHALFSPHHSHNFARQSFFTFRSQYPALLYLFAAKMRLSSLPLLIATLCNAQQYFLESSFSGPSFFENFNFWTAGDPTYGYVHYVDQAVAEQYGMINTTARNSTVWGVDTTQTLDPTANLGRFSIRLTSIQSWTHGLFVLDLEHMPANQCGAWPAFWTLGSGTWPENGKLTQPMQVPA